MLSPSLTFQKMSRAARGSQQEDAMDSWNELKMRFAENPGAVMEQNRAEARSRSKLRSRALKLGERV